jgi:UDP-N-acetylglucosamine acyltransferase
VADGNDIPRLLPHRYPFLLVDRVVEFAANERIVALKNVTANEPQFTGHFPERPIMPGVLICEALAQAGGLLVQGSVDGGLSLEAPGGKGGDRPFLVLTSIENAKFRRQVVPGDQLRLDVTLVRQHRPLWRMRGVATVDGQVAAQAEFSAIEVGDGGAAPSAGESGRAAPVGGIHPTAVVAPGAEIGPGVEIDAYATVGPHVTLGRGTWVGSHASIDGHTVVGEENRIYPFAAVGSEPQDLKYRGEPGRLVMGDRNLVREFASISIGTEGGGMVTRIGDANLFMNYAHVGHDCQIGNHVHMVNGVALAGHILVEDHAIVSGLAAVAQFVRIGESAFIGGGSMVVMDVPPYCIANGDRAKLVGLNLVGLERRGFDAGRVGPLKRAYRLLFQSKLLARDAVERVRAELAPSDEAQRLAAFVAASERGVTRP